jgi:precorrin-6B methylase 2
VLASASIRAQQADAPPFEPQSGQPGKDVVWVPTPQVLVEKMLDVAKVTPNDYIIDLGSGDGRNVIAAAKRGARALGVEFNPDMVRLSRYNAEKAGVSDKATFVEGDMYAADISKATALILFLLPHNLERLTPAFLNLPPGTRIVDNTFEIPGWKPDVTERVETGCATWCTALMWIVPAKVDGVWKMGAEELRIEQSFQYFKGTHATSAATAAIENGRLDGAEISFRIGGADYIGKVDGNRMEGVVTSGGAERRWTATR